MTDSAWTSLATLSKGERRLAAIMFTDVAGYTTLGQRNESLSIALIDAQRDLIKPILARHNGREVKTAGDSFLVEFTNALDAVRFAYDIQRATRELNISLPDERRLHLRIGLHLGDITKSRGDIYGDAVNVASRIESLAEDGGVCLTRQVYDQVQNKFELPLKSIGSKPLKNVREPVEIYKMEFPWEKSRVPEQLNRRRIAVLPFANMSPDPNDSYFADGMTEEIISTLSGMSGFSVVARTSVMSYKGTTKKVKEIGSELEAGSILEGSFRKAGNKIRVTTQLIDIDSDKHVWVQSYDRDLDDVFAVQTDIAKQVSDALRIRILAKEIDRIEMKPTESTKAYSLYLRGRFFLNRRRIEDLIKAAECFGDAAREDPKFALAYTGLAESYEALAGWDRDVRLNHEKAKAAVDRALELDPELAEAHAARAFVLYSDFRLREAEDEITTAIRLKPSYATAHVWYSVLLNRKERWDEALEHIEKAVELDPLSQIICRSYAEYYESRRNYPKAAELFKKAMELDPNVSITHFALGRVYHKMKMFAEGRQEVEIGFGLQQMASPPKIRNDAVRAYWENDAETVRRALAELEAHFGEVLVDAFLIAGLNFYLGNIDKGFRWLRESYKGKEPELLSIRIDEKLDNVRSDPRYRHLVKRLGLG